MNKLIRNLGITLFTASALMFSQANAVVSTDLGVDDPSLFGLFCCCDWCGTCCEDDVCDGC